ncbi:MAG TPA: hypothetical protein VFB62_21505 [Polyangiaceae bacterium]|jgi:predicted regulator of Ras-like GTPase activity (Roadblock/LC7/MglB family)|nr:hypothetical protein [Polyangiaceae bacterium]
MAEPTLETLVSPIGSLRGAMLVTVEDALLYRAWQREGERWSAELGAARYGDMMRATRSGLGYLGPSELEQLTIETNDVVALLQPLNDAVFAILLFDADTPLGLARHHAARLQGGLQSIASAVGPVGAAASRRAAALSAALEEAAPASRPVPPPPPTPVTQSAESFPAVPEPAPTGSLQARPSPTLVSDAATWEPESPAWDAELPAKVVRPGATTLVTGSMAAVMEPLPGSEPTIQTPAPVPPEPPPIVAVPLEEEDTAPELSQLEPITRPRETSPLPGPERPPESSTPGERARQLFAHLADHAPDGHTALARVALQTGLPSDLLRNPTRIGAHDLALIEAAVRRILGLERLHI